MGESKHTPGPWITFQPRGDGSVPVRTDGLGLTICYVHDGAICDALVNARLIAAAPELLDALRDARSMLATVEVIDGEDDDPWSKAIARMDAAIAKAEGRS